MKRGIKILFVLSMLFQSSLEGFLDQCSDRMEDSDLMVNVNCSIVDGLLHASVDIQYDQDFSELNLYSNCSDRMARTEDTFLFGVRQSFRTSFLPLNSSGSCELYGCIKPNLRPYINTVVFTNQVCPGLVPSSLSSASPSATTILSITQNTNVGKTSAITPSTEAPTSSSHGTANRVVFPLAVATPLLVAFIATLLVAVLVATVWCRCSSRKKSLHMSQKGKFYLQ